MLVVYCWLVHLSRLIAPSLCVRCYCRCCSSHRFDFTARSFASHSPSVRIVALLRTSCFHSTKCTHTPATKRTYTHTHAPLDTLHLTCIRRLHFVTAERLYTYSMIERPSTVFCALLLLFSSFNFCCCCGRCWRYRWVLHRRCACITLYLCLFLVAFGTH